jgi:hypothetical protein
MNQFAEIVDPVERQIVRVVEVVRVAPCGTRNGHNGFRILLDRRPQSREIILAEPHRRQTPRTSGK